MQSNIFSIMYISYCGLLVRNLALAIANGGITLIILLIAPLGLAAVVINTALITISTFLTATASDRLIQYLLPSQPSKPMNPQGLAGADPFYRISTLNTRTGYIYPIRVLLMPTILMNLNIL